MELIGVEQVPPLSLLKVLTINDLLNGELLSKAAVGFSLEATRKVIMHYAG